MTDSKIGFFHFVEPDQKTLTLQMWSTNTLNNMCTAEGKGSHYSIDLAGVWVDCVHQQGPVIHNDYEGLPHRKGMPPGHAPVVRELFVPVFQGDTIVAILGVGNKPSDYEEPDVKEVSRLAEIAWDIVMRKKAEEQLRASLKEKEVLLREIHHRVKNNLAIISSLLSIQSQYVSDEAHRKMFQDSMTRVHSMAVAHEKLYQSRDLADLNVPDFIDSLVDHLVSDTASVGTAISLKKAVDPVSLGLDTAVPLGFILSELVSNCIKHAFPEGSQGEVDISFRSLGEKTFELAVSDNGVGIPDGLDLQNPQSLGLDLVGIFVQQLFGEMEVIRKNGTEIRIRFKEIIKPKR